MLFITIQFGLVFLCGMIATWRVHIPNDTVSRIAFGAAIGFFISTWISSFALSR